MEKFLQPAKHSFMMVAPKSEPGPYLERNHNNILAEFWSLLESPSVDIFEITVGAITNEVGSSCTELSDIYYRHQPEDRFPGTTAAAASREALPLSEFHHHFGVFKGKFCLLFSRNQSLFLCEGSPALRNHTDRIDGMAQLKMNMAQPRRFAFFDYGYIGDYINELRACSLLLSLFKQNPEFSDALIALADPTKRQDAGFICASAESLQRPGISAANEGQANAIQSLKYSVEAIQGPPGTGKSTLIAHILRSSLVASEVALVTCVQNKAVDAIAEKLRTIEQGQVPFFVVGNPDRMGLIAKQWTLDEQVARDPSVIALQRTLVAIRKRAALATDFFRNKAALLNSNYLQARRNLLSESKFKKRVSDMSDEEKMEMQRWMLQDPWKRLWDAYIRSKYSVKLVYSERLRDKVRSLGCELGTLIAFVRAEIITSARAILATTATASSLLANDPAFQPAFLKMGTVIIDEAGTVPEIKLPLLISLNPSGLRRIIAIGDQNQLAPFTRQSTVNSSGQSSICFAYAGTGRCVRGISCRFKHTRKNPTDATAGDTGPMLGFFQRVEKCLSKGRIPLLTEQFRMHPSVSNFISKNFYDCSLTTNPLVAASRLSADPQGLYWLDYNEPDAETTLRGSTSKVNNVEALLAISLLDREDFIGKSVMIITFYKAQETLMKKMLLSMGQSESEARRILSVDQSQGSEADIVILSCVRCNDRHNIGFLNNNNRMNVAVSRMRYQLIVIGSISTLGADIKWASLYDQAKKIKGGEDISASALHLENCHE